MGDEARGRRRRVRRVGTDELVPGQPTPGMRRQEAIAFEDLWSGVVHTDAGVASGWHHHGSHDTIAYVLEGGLLVESGPGGRESVEAGPGDFVHIPAGVVHRESNPTGTEAAVVVVRRGTGVIVTNVQGPDPDSDPS